MDPFHERLARVGLEAAGRYGFALAGGYAVQAAGLLERPSEDVDLFIGPVLHPDDAVANKMSALYGRAFARDFIDIDATLRSGRYSGEDLLRLAERADSGFDRRIFAAALGQAGLLDPADFAQYGITGQNLDEVRNRFAAWRHDLLTESSPE